MKSFTAWLLTQIAYKYRWEPKETITASCSRAPVPWQSSHLTPTKRNVGCQEVAQRRLDFWFLKLQTLQLWSGCYATVGFLSSILEPQVMVRKKKKNSTLIYTVCRGCVFSIFWFFTVNMSPRGVIMGATLLCFLMGLLSPAQSARKLFFFN